MKDADLVSRHYTQGGLLAAINAGVERLGKTLETVTVEDLGPVDEFHIGGRMATRRFLDELAIGPDENVLDIGCGIGGTSRYAAKEYRCRVSGVDLTKEFIETGTKLCCILGVDSTVSLTHGSALDLEFDDASFDKAFMLHVGMNISDKTTLASEVWRVLKPGAVFGIYDIMLIEPGAIDFPVPWASGPEGSALVSPEDYRRALATAGFKIVSEHSRREFALEFFETLKTQVAQSDGPPPLGLHIIMGPSAPTKIQNMVSSIAKGTIAPIELIAVKA